MNGRQATTGRFFFFFFISVHQVGRIPLRHVTLWASNGRQSRPFQTNRFICEKIFVTQLLRSANTQLTHSSTYRSRDSTVKQIQLFKFEKFHEKFHSTNELFVFLKKRDRNNYIYNEAVNFDVKIPCAGVGTTVAAPTADA